MEPHKIARSKRRELDVTQAELAEMIGMSQASVQHFENGRYTSQTTIEKIFKVLDINLNTDHEKLLPPM